MIGDEFTCVKLKRDIITDAGVPIKAGEVGIPLQETGLGNWVVEFAIWTKESDGPSFPTAIVAMADLEEVTA